MFRVPPASWPKIAALDILHLDELHAIHRLPPDRKFGITFFVVYLVRVINSRLNRASSPRIAWPFPVRISFINSTTRSTSRAFALYTAPHPALGRAGRYS